MKRLDPGAAGFWVILWLSGLMLLSLAPTRTPNLAKLNHDDAPQVYYSHGMTSSVYQDLTGASTVRVRALRPVVED